jgi:hypothetical protein
MDVVDKDHSTAEIYCTGEGLEHQLHVTSDAVVPVIEFDFNLGVLLVVPESYSQPIDR